MRIYLIVLIVSVCCINYSYAQQEDVSFLLNTLKSNYAGYQDKVKAHDFDRYVKRILKEDKIDTFRILARIADYFNDHHIQVYQANSLNDSRYDTALAPQLFKKVNDYLTDENKKKEIREGYWVNDYGSTVIAIVTDKKPGGGYKIHLIESRYHVVPRGTVIAETDDKKGNKLFTRYLLPGNGSGTFLRTEFRNDSVLLLGEFSKYRKLRGYHSEKPIISGLPAFSLTNRGAPLDQDNYLLTIPDFAQEVGSIDSILKRDSLKIYTSRNLIIDLRDNRGGTVRSYQSLLPLIYTNPILGIRGKVLVSDDLLKTYKDALLDAVRSKQPDSTEIKELQKDVKEMEAAKGKFIDDSNGDTIRFDKVLESPQNVAVITNYACQSAAEMMLLDFKQSKKVKLFGERTFGAVDYLNGTTITTPSGKYAFTVATAKRTIPKGSKKIDGIGIEPDVPIADSDPDWVAFVKNYYAQQSKSQ